jgi:hypothetical protein
MGTTAPQALAGFESKFSTHTYNISKTDQQTLGTEVTMLVSGRGLREYRGLSADYSSRTDRFFQQEQGCSTDFLEQLLDYSQIS